MVEQHSLTTRQRRELGQALGELPEGRYYRRLLALREVDQGRPVAEVARSLEVSRQSVHAWLRAYRRTGSLAALADQPRSGRPSRWDTELRAQIEEWLEQSPQDYGYQATVWTVPLLQEHLRQACDQALGETTLRHRLHELGYTWKRSRYVLAPDPERGEKAAPHSGSAGAPGAPPRRAGAR
jgi:transposase